MSSRVGSVTEVLTDDVKHDGNNRSDGNGAPELEFPAGSYHSVLRGLDKLTERHILKTHSDIGKEYLVGDIRGDLGRYKSNDDTRHKGQNVLDRNSPDRSTEAS